MLDPQADGLCEFFGNPLEGIKVLYGIHMGLCRPVGDGFQLGSYSILNAHREDLYIRIPQLGGRLLEGVGRLAVSDEDGYTWNVVARPSDGLKDLLSHIGHGPASVGGATTVRESPYSLDHGVKVMVSVQIELGVGVPAVLDQADLDHIWPNVKGVHQNLQESSYFSKVSQADAVGTVNQEDDISLNINMRDNKRTF